MSLSLGPRYAGAQVITKPPLNPLILEYVIENNVTGVLSELQKGVNPNTTVSLWIINVANVKDSLKQKVKYLRDIFKNSTVTILEIAIALGNIDVIEILLKNGADINKLSGKSEVFYILMELRVNYEAYLSGYDGNFLGDRQFFYPIEKIKQIIDLLLSYGFIIDLDKLYIPNERFDVITVPNVVNGPISVGDIEFIQLLRSYGLDLKKVQNIKYPKIKYDAGKYLLEMVKFLYDNGIIPTDVDLYESPKLREYLKIPEYATKRNIINMPYVTHTCPKGIYLPVYRIENLYYGEKKKTDKQYCGTFYFYEPESKNYLHLGNTLICTNKVDAYIKLSIMSGKSSYDIFKDLTNGGNDIIGEIFFTYEKFLATEDRKLTFRELEYFNQLLMNEKMAEEITYKMLWTDEMSWNDNPDDVKDYNALYYDSDGNNVGVNLGEFDYLDQDICELASKHGYDTIILQKEPGEHRPNTEILDTRLRAVSFSSFCSIPNKPPSTLGKYPTIWFPDDGFVTETGAAVPVNVENMININCKTTIGIIDCVNQFFQKNMYDQAIVNIAKGDKDLSIRKLAEEYEYLHDHPLEEESPLYPGKGINNLMIICARGYLSLLMKKHQVQAKEFLQYLNIADISGKSALQYAAPHKELLEYIKDQGNLPAA